MVRAEATAARDVAPRDVTPHRARIALLAIVVLAFVLRVVYVLQSQSSPYFDEPQMDALYHVEWARAFASGAEHQPGPFFRAPLYPWFLGLVFRLFGDGLLLPRLVQAGIGALSCALVYAVAARAFDRRTGLVAAALCASYWMLVYFDGELLLPVLEVPTSLLAILFALRWGERPTTGRAALFGLALGLAAIVRPNVLLWAPLVGGWMLLRSGPGLAVRARHALAAALATLAPILPLTAYNAFAGHDAVLISSQGGVNFWIGNNPASDGSTAIAPGTRPDWWGGYRDTIHQAEVLEGRPLRPSEVSRHYAHKALAWMREHPLDAARLLAWKLWLYWTDWELGNNQDEVFFALRFGPILRWLPIGFGIAAPLGLLGLALSARRQRALFPLWIFVPAWCASVVLFFVCARFRVPMVPALLVFAAHALVWTLDTARARAWGRVALAAAATALLAFLVQQVPARVDRTGAKGLWDLGLHAAQHGDPERAVELYRESIAQNPRFPMAHLHLATALQALGRTAEAEAELRETLRLAPQNAGALQGLAELLLATGRISGGVECARRLLAAAPFSSAAHYTLARSLIAESEAANPAATALPEAEAELGLALDLAQDPVEQFNAHFALGRLLRTTERFAAALGAFERALTARPERDDIGWFWECQGQRLACYAALGRAAEAKRIARELHARYPDDPRAEAVLRPYLGP